MIQFHGSAGNSSSIGNSGSATTIEFQDGQNRRYRVVAGCGAAGVRVERGTEGAAGGVHWQEIAESVRVGVYGAQAQHDPTIQLIHALATALAAQAAMSPALVRGA